MAENLILGPTLACLAKISVPNFLCEFYINEQLGIIPGYHRMQFKEKLMSQTKENVKNLFSGPISTHLTQVQAPKFLQGNLRLLMLDIVPNYHPRQFKGKLMSQTEDNVKNLILGPILAHLAQTQAPKLLPDALPLLVVRDCSKLSSQAIQRKTNEPTEENVKNLISGPFFSPFGPNLGPKSFFDSFTATST